VECQAQEAIDEEEYETKQREAQQAAAHKQLEIPERRTRRAAGSAISTYIIHYISSNISETNRVDDNSIEVYLSEEEKRKHKSPELSKDGKELSKRSCIELYENRQRKQFISPSQIPFEPTKRMQLIEKHKRKRDLDYVSNRDSTVFKSDDSRNNISMEAHLVQDRGEVHKLSSRCNSYGNKS
jgi:hypothetical protein